MARPADTEAAVELERAARFFATLSETDGHVHHSPWIKAPEQVDKLAAAKRIALVRLGEALDGFLALDSSRATLRALEDEQRKRNSDRAAQPPTKAQPQAR